LIECGEAKTAARQTIFPFPLCFCRGALKKNRENAEGALLVIEFFVWLWLVAWMGGRKLRWKRKVSQWERIDGGRSLGMNRIQTGSLRPTQWRPLIASAARATAKEREREKGSNASTAAARVYLPRRADTYVLIDNNTTFIALELRAHYTTN
jgi:hypothetical protein